MAFQVGQWWYPDRYTVGHRKLLLSPDKTPMENLWFLIDVCCSIWLAKYGIYGYSKESIEELEQDCRLLTFLRLRNLVRNGTYRRQFSLYLNVRWCAWGSVPNCISSWKLRHIDIHAKLVSIDTPLKSQNNEGDELTLGDSLASHEAKRLRTQYDLVKDCDVRNNKQLTLDDVEIGKSGYQQVWKAITESEWDYYLQSCSEFGLEPISKEDFLQRNFPPPGRTKSERELRKAAWGHKYWLDHKDDPVWREKHRAACRLRYHRRKDKKKEQG